MTRHLSPQERRTQILQAARDCFAERGYAVTRVEEIAKAAGLSKGGLYVHFASKEAIFDALHDEEVARAGEALALIRALPLPAREKLGALAAGIVARYVSSEQHRRFLLVLGEVGLSTPSVQAKVLATHGMFVAAITEMVEEGIASGEFRPVDPRHAALLLKVLSDGIEGAIALGYEMETAAFLQEAVDILLHGLASRSASPAASPHR
jgi:AcrR family transcriptional regulator